MKPKRETGKDKVGRKSEKPVSSRARKTDAGDKPKRSYKKDKPDIDFFDKSSEKKERTLKRKRIERKSEEPKRRDGFAAKHREEGDGPKTDNVKRSETRRDTGRGSSRPPRRRDDEGVERRPYKPRGESSDSRPPRRRDDEGGERRPYKPRGESSDSRPPRRRDDEGVERRPYKPRGESSDSRPPRRRDDEGGERRPNKPRGESKDSRPPRRRDDEGGERRPYKPRGESSNSRPRRSNGDYSSNRPAGRNRSSEPRGRADGLIRLNKYIADSGMCSRREADDLISAGAVKVNGEITNILGTRVHPDDKVQIGDETLSREAKRYVLLNKPKDYITTNDDPQGRKTVMFLVREACRERIYPVGRLDRNTSGVLLFTNDGEMTKKLTHPSHRIRKVYHVVLDQSISEEDYQKIEEGIELDDGFIKVDAIEFVGENRNRKELGIEIHSGRNRIVRRIFEQLGYNISKLDRVVFAGLTKKDLPRGKWRNLSREEINFLKML